MKIDAVRQSCSGSTATGITYGAAAERLTWVQQHSTHVLVQAADDGRYDPLSKYCANASVIVQPAVTPGLFSSGCHRALAMGKTSMLQAGR